MSYRVLNAVHVTAQIDGDSIDVDIEPGDVDLRPELGEVLVAQGVAIPLPIDGDAPAELEPAPEADEATSDEAPADEPKSPRKTSKTRTDNPEA